jgi:hypothetical protein
MIPSEAGRASRPALLRQSNAPGARNITSKRRVTANARPGSTGSGRTASGAASSSSVAADPSVASLPPAPGATAAIPLLDDTAKLLESPLKYALEGRARFGADVFKAPVLLQSSVHMVTTAKAITELLADDGNRCVCKGWGLWVAPGAGGSVLLGGKRMVVVNRATGPRSRAAREAVRRSPAGS